MSFKIVAIGEVLWDLLPQGPQLGGAPANFACHAKALGAEATLISRIGADPLGRDALSCLRARGLRENTIQIDNTLQTGRVLVSLNEAGIPTYTIQENVAWDFIQVTGAEEKLSCQADAVCFGTLAQRSEVSRTNIQQFIRSASSEALRVLDLNLRQHFYTKMLIEESLGLANVLKLNEDELSCLTKLLELKGDECGQISQLSERYELKVVICTRGPRGSLIMSEGKWSEHHGVPTRVADTVGAGDAFTAAAVLGLLRTWNLDEISHRANQVAAYVASCPGATPELPRSVTSGFQERSPGLI